MGLTIGQCPRPALITEDQQNEFPGNYELACGKVRSRPIGTVGCEGQGAWYFLRVLC